MPEQSRLTSAQLGSSMRYAIPPRPFCAQSFGARGSPFQERGMEFSSCSLELHSMDCVEWTSGVLLNSTFHFSQKLSTMESMFHTNYNNGIHSFAKTIKNGIHFSQTLSKWILVFRKHYKHDIHFSQNYKN